MIRHIWTLLIIVVLVLAFWFILGVLVPIYIFPNLDESGKFGDGFGSVNALFSGMGFIALSYTIYLQLRFREEQKGEEMFQLYIKLYDDIKKGLDQLTFLSKTGVAAYAELHHRVEINLITDELESTASFITVLTHEFINLIHIINDDKSLKSEQRVLLKNKILSVYSMYYSDLYDAMARQRPDNFSIKTLARSFNDLEAALSDLPDDMKFLLFN
jgi:hypothetical protein